jgi:Rieske Fe-S protein
MHDTINTISRRSFLRKFRNVIALPYVLFGGLMVRKHLMVYSGEPVRISIPEDDGIYFHDEVILIKKDGKIELLSAKCTHLGCIINRVEQANFVCPCHGSRFNEDGSIVKGPAVKSLTKLTYVIDPQTKELIVKS